MISSEVQRTLVKSPPELWAEISDPDALARHLGEFGEIHITRVHPEQKVEWEASEASGAVVIKPSGWGTKVKLTVTRELTAHAVEREPVPDAEPALDHDLETEPEHALEAEPEPLPEPELGLDVEAETEDETAIASEPEPRRGFFARLFGRRRAERHADPVLEQTLEQQQPAEEQLASAEAGEHEHPYNAMADWATQIELEAEDAPSSSAQLEIDEQLEPEPQLESPPEESSTPVHVDISAEIKAAEEIAAEEVTAVLTGVLDRLGAAHHRPFSRA